MKNDSHYCCVPQPTFVLVNYLHQSILLGQVTFLNFALFLMHLPSHSFASCLACRLHY